jgi:histidinol-phosphate aminotransferase
MLLVRLSAPGEAPHDTASRVFNGLKARGVLVKNVSAMHPLLAGCLRLTVGTPVENQRLVAALTEAVPA